MRAIAGPDPGVGSRSPASRVASRGTARLSPRAPIPTRRARVLRASAADADDANVPLARRLLTAALGVAAFAAPHAAPFVVSTTDARGASSTSRRLRLRGDHGFGFCSGPRSRGGLPPRHGDRARVSARTIDFLRWLDGVRAGASLAASPRPPSARVSTAWSRTRRSPSPRSRPRRRTTRPPSAPVHVETRKVEKYLERIVTRDRVERGAELIARHAALLSDVHDTYGVPPEIIVAIWGIESSFGAFAGNSDCVWALANLAWEQKSGDGYFRNELIEATRIVDQGHAEAGKLTGSWDGGLGQCQFMPSNFHRYAVDKDGDGRADIWRSLPDVFASMGNFISTYCEWDPSVRHAGWRVEVGDASSLGPEVVGGYWGERKEPRPAKFFLWNGVRTAHKRSAPAPSAETSLLMPDGGGNDRVAFLATKNFRAIMRYNPSTQYAMAVATLAREIVDEAAIVAERGEGGETTAADAAPGGVAEREGGG